MKTIKIILGVLGGLFATLCIFVLIGAFNPEFTEKMSGIVNGREEEYKNEELSGTIPETGIQIEEPEVLPAEIEEGYDKNGLRNPYSEKLHYEVPDKELEISRDVAGLYGYLPITSLKDPSRQEAENAEKYGETGENLSFDTLTYPYYGMLSDALQKVYRQVYANANALNGTFVPLENLNETQMRYVLEAVYNDHPELFWLETSFSCKYYTNGICKEVTLKFNRTVDRIEDCRREFTDVVNDIIYGANNYTEDFEKERYVHDALLGRLEYNLAAEMGQSAYSALVNKETVCAGYARAYQYLLQKLGIPCYYCTGYAGENHAWNIVKLDKAYYNVDVTWDDVEPNSYKYFNQTDKVFAKDHIRTGLSVYLPACKGTKYQKETENRVPNMWQNSSGNATDQSGTTYWPEEEWGDGVGYEGTLLTSLQEYYDNCKSQLSKGGDGETIIFYNFVDSETLMEIYNAYDSGEYKKGYLSEALKTLGASYGKVTIKVSVWLDPDADKEPGEDEKQENPAESEPSEEETDETQTGESETQEEKEEEFIPDNKQYLLRHEIKLGF